MQWLNEKDVSRITKLSLPTLRNWRSLNKGPRYTKLGKSVRYSEDDLRQFMASHNVAVSQN